MPKPQRTYAPRIADHVWERHRDRITALFVGKDKVLKDVVETMKRHGLHASVSQYERKLKDWGVRKNRTRAGRYQTTYPMKIPTEHTEDAGYGKDEDASESYAELAKTPPRSIKGISPGPLDGVEVPVPSESGSRRQRARDIWSLGCVFSLAAAWLVLRDDSLETINKLARTAYNGCFHDGFGVMAAARDMAPIIGREFSSIIESILNQSHDGDAANEASASDLGDPVALMTDFEFDPGGCSSYGCSPSTMPTWDATRWESMGVTAEEWISYGWNVFFGGYG